MTNQRKRSYWVDEEPAGYEINGDGEGDEDRDGYQVLKNNDYVQYHD